MSKNDLFVGENPVKKTNHHVSGGYVQIKGDSFYKISDFDQMRPFFMSLVSHSDHWLFIASTGGLSAGRKDENGALFPYYTDDKITESSELTGSKTIFLLDKNDRKLRWEPFSSKYEGLYQIRRNIYKNIIGNKIIFEEINEDLKVRFRYSWQFSEKYGFSKQSSIINLSHSTIHLEVLDGLQNLLPYGVTSGMQNEKSNLINAYKKNELDLQSGLGLFSLSSIIVDKAEPSESLKTTTVWSVGIDPLHLLLSNRQLDKFRNGFDLETEEDVRAEKGCYFLHSKITLEPEQEKGWYMIAEINQGHTDVIGLINELIKDRKSIHKRLVLDIEAGTTELKKLVGMADGFQVTEDQLSTGRHYTNVLFNIMRGGIFEDQYQIESRDFYEYVKLINTGLSQRFADFFSGLPDLIIYRDLIEKAQQTGNADLIRICYEYLPLTFSRRHGDPSRPWNKFSIKIKNEDGIKIRHYEGNWRDIFQNWEALVYSFPEYIESMIWKFVNASTIDGYNPYRISREGIDWEIIEPDDPWSYIGYWGDHQIIYLLKLLEISDLHHPKILVRLLSMPYFVYANVPYRIKSYDQIVKNPKDTIDYDFEQASVIEEKVKVTGSDGKLIWGKDGQIIRATLAEKLLVSLLAKLSNFIPEAGIWLNTQRPEWNDANNALVGNGSSMVTLYYMRRFITFCLYLFNKTEEESFHIHKSVVQLLANVFQCFDKNKQYLDTGFSDENRKTIMDILGRSGETYRMQVKKTDFEEDLSVINKSYLLGFFELVLKYIDQTIKANRRVDGLYHAYNLIKIEKDRTSIIHLYEMLEGQVAVLSSGILDKYEVVEVLNALKQSAMYRHDQYSYLLYPDRELPRFLQKNNIPLKFIEKSALARELMKDGNKILIEKDVQGGYHFNGTFTNSESLRQALDTLKDSGYRELVESEYDDYFEIFEQMFNHRSFTGRSGTFFGYEGLGSIYWHMVSKLLLATQECIFAHANKANDSRISDKMINFYYEIRAGIGINKSPELYGAFPTDPYSHTPGNKGAQQPGMTGQVKEDIINRWAELGVIINKGQISFKPIFLDKKEFLTEERIFEYFDVNGIENKIIIIPGELIFTYCQVPVIYQKGVKTSIQIDLKNGTSQKFDGNTLTEEVSKEIFNRTGKIVLIRVSLDIS